MTKTTNRDLCYLITVSREHFLSAQMLLRTLVQKTDKEIIIVGNLQEDEIKELLYPQVKYIDEEKIDLTNRMPNITWDKKFRNVGWYKQQMIRLSIDRFIKHNFVVILDSETFVFNNWSEERFFDEKTGKPKYLYWTPDERKPEWDYQMYEGAAYLLKFLPECKNLEQYVKSNDVKRSISGVNFFSTNNIKHIWKLLDKNTELQKNLKYLFSKDNNLSFSEYMFYCYAVDYGLFKTVDDTILEEDLFGWYENHKESSFQRFKTKAMWSMCQSYYDYTKATEYLRYMRKIADELKEELPQIDYWNEHDVDLVRSEIPLSNSLSYFKKYKKQLNYTKRMRYVSFKKTLELAKKNISSPVFVEVGTLRDKTRGGGHSTFKFAEYCSMNGGEIHTIDLDKEAIDHAVSVTLPFTPWIKFHTSDSTSYIKKHKGKIDILYLDGLDSTPGNEELASSKQLEEIKAAMPKLSEECVVVLDDSDLPEGGKTKYSSKYLEKQGFVLWVNNYQRIYTRNLGKPPFLLVGLNRMLYKIKSLRKSY